jgi:hypothetical protein
VRFIDNAGTDDDIGTDDDVGTDDGGSQHREANSMSVSD